MAKQATLTTITSANNTVSTLNANFNALNTALLNTLSRDGSTPNPMTADFDLNGNDLLNATSLSTGLLYIDGSLVNSIGNLANWAGTWATATGYSVYDIVFHDDGVTQALYRCLINHTSGTFVTDRDTNAYWEVYIGGDYVIDQANAKLTGGTMDGVTIGGTTPANADIVDLTLTGALDVSGISNAATVLTDLGAQAQDDLLDDIAAITAVQGDIFYVNGTPAIVDLPIGTARQSLRVNSGATAPEWQDDLESFIVALSDEGSTDLVTGTAIATFRMPYAFTVTDVRAHVQTAPTGAAIQVDINEGGTSILSTKLTIDATEKTSTTAATPAVISDSALADDAEITFDIDQVGSTIAGNGLKVTIIGYRT